MRLGMLGGTFDPIHLGHLLLAEQAREQLSLDEVLLVPAGRPPHKPSRVLTPWPLRYRMCELALLGVEGIHPADLEKDPTRPSFTVDTLRRLRSDHGAGDLWLLVGRDCLAELPTWHEPEEILRLASLAVYPRPGAETSGEEGIDRRRVVFLEGPRLLLSSSEIRARVHGGRSVRFLVPETVRAFIGAEGLYLGPEWDGALEGDPRETWP